MKNFASKVQRFLESEDGPTAVEYAIMAALIGAVIIGTVRLLGQEVDSVFSDIESEIANI